MHTVLSLLRDKHRRNLLTGHAVSGVKGRELQQNLFIRGAYMQTITIKWSGAFSLERFNLCVLASDNGIYAISRLWGNTKTLLYIGRTKREFQKRLREHDYWLKLYRGQIIVRLGRIISPRMSFSEKLLADAEALLIILNETLENTSNVTTYSGRALTINNIGRRGLLEKWICSNDLEDY